jgi:trehalose-6-phosphatase
MPVFVGDDLTDEFGFAAANRMAAGACWSARAPSLARHALPDIRRRARLAAHHRFAGGIPHLTAPRRIRPTDQGPA